MGGGSISITRLYLSIPKSKHEAGWQTGLNYGKYKMEASTLGFHRFQIQMPPNDIVIPAIGKQKKKKKKIKVVSKKLPGDSHIPMTCPQNENQRTKHMPCLIFSPLKPDTGVLKICENPWVQLVYALDYFQSPKLWYQPDRCPCKVKRVFLTDTDTGHETKTSQRLFLLLFRAEPSWLQDLSVHWVGRS